MTLRLCDQTAIVGIGQSEYGRFLPSSQLALGASALKTALDEGPRLTANMVGLPNERLAVGLAVVMDFDEVRAGITLPRPRPAAD